MSPKTNLKTTSKTTTAARTKAPTVSIKKTESVFDELSRIQDRIMRRAHDIFTGSGHVSGSDLEHWLEAERELLWKPAIELSEKNNEFQLQFAVPGIDPKSIHIDVTPEDIVVKADLQHGHTEEQSTVHACEFATGTLFRAVHLPKPIDPGKVKATFKDGMLILKAPIAVKVRAKKVKTATS